MYSSNSPLLNVKKRISISVGPAQIKMIRALQKHYDQMMPRFVDLPDVKPTTISDVISAALYDCCVNNRIKP